MDLKILPHHQERLAYVYLRQSTMAQVRGNQESTQRQYALKNKASALGWKEHSIKILDGDLGMSGTQMTSREDFKTLIAEVSLKKVGAVFALEASRLSRSCMDWHRLLEICALTDTLIIDEDGCYNPREFNDQMLLGLKGTMSYAESHFIRARLLGGKRNKAKKGELRNSLPIGFLYDKTGKIVIDSDQEVQSLIYRVFKIFHECGTANGVARYFAHHNMQFPKRIHDGVGWILSWGRLRTERVRAILKNPCYAGGVYVWTSSSYEKTFFRRNNSSK